MRAALACRFRTFCLIFGPNPEPRKSNSGCKTTTSQVATLSLTTTTMGMMHFLYFSPIPRMVYRQKLRLLLKPI